MLSEAANHAVFESETVTFMQNFRHMKENRLLSDTVQTHLEILLSHFLWKRIVGELKRTILSAKGSKQSSLDGLGPLGSNLILSPL